MDQQSIFYLEWWILKRGEERMIVASMKGGNPLYGYGSWDLAVETPYPTYEEAEKYLPESITEFIVDASIEPTFRIE